MKKLQNVSHSRKISILTLVTVFGLAHTLSYPTGMAAQVYSLIFIVIYAAVLIYSVSIIVKSSGWIRGLAILTALLSLGVIVYDSLALSLAVYM